MRILNGFAEVVFKDNLDSPFINPMYYKIKQNKDFIMKYKIFQDFIQQLKFGLGLFKIKSYYSNQSLGITGLSRTCGLLDKFQMPPKGLKSLIYCKKDFSIGLLFIKRIVSHSRKNGFRYIKTAVHKENSKSIFATQQIMNGKLFYPKPVNCNVHGLEFPAYIFTIGLI